MASLGDIIYRASSVWKRLVGNTTTIKKFLTQTGDGANSAAPTWGQVNDSDVQFTDITTGNASSSAHGYLKKLNNDATTYMDGTGNYSTPSSSTITQKLTIVERNTQQSINANTWTAVSWNNSVRDDVGAYSAGSPTILTVPSGYTKVRLTVYTVWSNIASNIARYARIDKNGTTIEVDIALRVNEAGGHFTTRWLTVATSDTLSILVLHLTGVATNIEGAAGTFGAPSYIQAEWAA